MMRTLAIALGVLIGASASPALSEPTLKDFEKRHQESLSSELAAVQKTQGLLADKKKTRQEERKKRIRALYKLSRASFPKLWVEPKEQQHASRWLAAARRIATRDHQEIALLDLEIEHANQAEGRVRHALEDERETQALLPGLKTLRRPQKNSRVIKKFGVYKESPRVRLRRRGIELSVIKGNPVFAPASGTVRYAGPIRGLGQGIIIDHKGYTSILGRLQDLQVEAGEWINGESAIALAADELVYVEMRLAIGALGQPFNPRPYM
jgi:septal ring factor EnvC (AmiA/AmiB activator)